MRLTTEEAYRRYADRVFAAAFSVCRNQDESDDVVQDTFIRYHTGKYDYTDENHIRAWLIRVAVNRARDLRMSFWKRSRVSWEEYMAELPFEEPEDSRLFAAVMNLPGRYRTVIHLYYYEDLSVKEIADVLGKREGTVKSLLSRGRDLLKKTLTEEWNDDE